MKTEMEQLNDSILKALAGETTMNGNSNKSNGLTDKLHLRIPMQLKARLIAEANVRSQPGKQITPSDVVREILEEHFAQKDRTALLTPPTFQSMLAMIEAKRNKL
jgi:hypothetical protein